jgi:sensor domain CHASE-containing protein
VLVVLVATLYFGARGIIESKFEHLEERDARKDLERVQLALADRGVTMEATAQDWATWDDMYAFVENGNEAFVAENLTPTALMHIRMQMMAVLDGSGRLVWGGALDAADGEKWLSGGSFRDGSGIFRMFLRLVS